MTAVTTIEEIAESLTRAEAKREPVAPITDTHPELTVGDAYAIQFHNTQARVGEGAEIAGHKIGLTSKAMQEMLGVSEPDYGVIFGDCVIANGGEVPASELIAPRIEPEITFVLAERLEGRDLTVEEVLEATEYVVPSLEIIDSRIADWRIGLVDTIADNASFGRLVLGDRRTPPGDSDLAAAQAEIVRNGEVAGSGTGDAVLGHPARAVAWLAAALSEHGVALEPGHVVMPGSLTTAAPLEPGDHVTADFGALGSVEVTCV